MIVAQGNLRRGQKGQIDQIPDDLTAEAALGRLNAMLTPEGAAWVRRVDLDALCGQMTAQYQRAAAYPLEILRRRGAAALEASTGSERERPDRVVVGTVHAVKGGESTNVLLFPDLSPRGWQQYRQPGWNGRDAIRRVFYVAVTRSRKRLVIGAPSGGLCAAI
jgi:superfamily I DNA/RNA helicase